MIYASGGPTHFYGSGQPDPLRPDPTLQCLEAKSARFAILAAEAGCTVLNLSDLPSSRLAFRRADRSALAAGAAVAPPDFDPGALAQARAAEAALGYEVPSGKYWRCFDRIDPHALARVGALWLDAFYSFSAAA
jgi:hypothetical protein